MITIDNEYVVGCDIDDTLVMHHWPDDIDTCNLLQIEDPIDKNKNILVRVNYNMVRLIKEEAARGAYIIFWSAGGYQWAENVISALKLGKYISNAMIMTKPNSYLDDKEVGHWLKRRVYIDPDKCYKREVNLNKE